MNAIANTNPEQLIIGAIVRHVSRELLFVERQFFASRTATANHLLEDLKTFVYQSELSFGSDLPLLDKVLAEVRGLLYRLSYNFYDPHFLLVLRYIRSEISALNNQSTLLGAA